MLAKLLRALGCSVYNVKSSAVFVYNTAYKAIKGHYQSILANDHAGLNKEYNELQSPAYLVTSEEAQRDFNADKDRYKNVLPFEHNRVKLSGENDYINASLLEGQPCGQCPGWTYIAAQGPLAGTVPDFWKMVFEKGANVLVMLTRTVENSHIKCADYFALDAGKTVQHGKFDITTVVVEEVSHHITKRRLSVKDRQTDKCLEVTHFHYHQWPDFGVPEITEPIRQLCHLLYDRGAPTCQKSPNTIVHCSAGIGRTGTFVAIDIMLKRLWWLSEHRHDVDATCVEQAVDMPAVVGCLRKQRRGMVQSLEQYQFCYQAVVEEVEAARAMQ